MHNARGTSKLEGKLAQQTKRQLWHRVQCSALTGERILIFNGQCASGEHSPGSMETVAGGARQLSARQLHTEQVVCACAYRGRATASVACA
jgi:hypothetical protein